MSLRNPLMIHTYDAFVTVDTKHDQALIDTLDHAAKRDVGYDGTGPNPYAQELFEDLFEKFDGTGIVICQFMADGDITFDIEARSPAQLQRALRRSREIIRRWMGKYRVNYLKTAEEPI